MKSAERTRRFGVFSVSLFSLFAGNDFEEDSREIEAAVEGMLYEVYVHNILQLRGVRDSSARWEVA